jgi:hypothetical protein
MRKTILLAAAFVAGLSGVTTAQSGSAAAEGFSRLKSLEGEWIDVDGAFGVKGKVAVT